MIEPRVTRRTLLATPALVQRTFGQRSSAPLVYFGTYTRGQSKGIYCCRFDASSGETAGLTLAAEMANPSFLAIHPNRRFLYAVSEAQGGTVASFRIDQQSGILTRLNETSSRGAGPCHVQVDPTGKLLGVANYGGGSTALLRLNTDGSLQEAASFHQHTGSSVNQARQREPHAHSFNFSRDSRFAVVADLGIDKLQVYAIDAATGMMKLHGSAAMKPGAGPRHFTFHLNGRFAYAINELDSTITALSWNAGTLTVMESVSTLPSGWSGQSTTAEVVVHPNGRFVYGSNRGHDSIALFQVNEKTGQLTPAGHFPTGGRTPRNFAIHPSGRWLFAANQNSGSVVIFRLDEKTGSLSPMSNKLDIDAAVCVRFLG